MPKPPARKNTQPARNDTQPSTTPKEKNNTTGGARRISERVKKAIHLVVHQGKTQMDAEKEADLSSGYFTIVMKKPHVRQYFNEQKVIADTDIAQLRASGEKVALITAIDLLQNSKDERIRVKMVEFLASKAPPSASPVTIVNAPGGYVYSDPRDPASGAKDVTPEEDQ
ncbi:hypothetical protein [Jannaschia pagri]|nr:hypothetical protein [Jannaschia sp. AI_62]